MTLTLERLTILSLKDQLIQLLAFNRDISNSNIESIRVKHLDKDRFSVRFYSSANIDIHF